MYDKDNKNIPGNKLLVYLDDVNVADITIDSDGNYSYEVENPSMGYHSVCVKHLNDGVYGDAEYFISFEVVERKESKLTITDVTGVDSNDIKYGDNVQISGTLTDAEGNPIVYEYVGCMGSSQSTDEEGKFIIDTMINDANVTVFFNGNYLFSKSNATKEVQLGKGNKNIALYWINGYIPLKMQLFQVLLYQMLS